MVPARAGQTAADEQLANLIHSERIILAKYRAASVFPRPFAFLEVPREL
jgi:hypothetical protein